MPKRSKPDAAAERAAKEARRESGRPGGGAGRRDEVGPTGVYPMSGGIPEGHHPEIRTPASWGQGDRGAEGYNDSGGSELYMHEGQLLGGLTSGPGGEPTIDIHGGDTTGTGRPAADDQPAKHSPRRAKGRTPKKAGAKKERNE